MVAVQRTGLLGAKETLRPSLFQDQDQCRKCAETFVWKETGYGEINSLIVCLFSFCLFFVGLSNLLCSVFIWPGQCHFLAWLFVDFVCCFLLQYVYSEGGAGRC